MLKALVKLIQISTLTLYLMDVLDELFHLLICTVKDVYPLVFWDLPIIWVRYKLCIYFDIMKLLELSLQLLYLVVFAFDNK